MTLQQLRYIVEVYKCGSITEAAHRLFIAQPSLSKAIKDVEDEFHITILKRGRHGASFTEDGMKFLQFAHRVLDASDDIYEYFSQDQPKEKDIYLSVSSQHSRRRADPVHAAEGRRGGLRRAHSGGQDAAGRTGRPRAGQPDRDFICVRPHRLVYAPAV